MSQVSLRHLRCFLAVAETGSFTAAAAQLFITQSALTAAIRQFEELSGVTLFERTTRKVDLTEEARLFRPIAERVVRDFEHAVDELAAIGNSQRGHVRAAASPSMVEHLLTPALATFWKTHPEITVSVADGSSAKVEQMVMQGDVDLGIATKLAGYDDLRYTPILSDRFGVIFPSDHPLAASQTPLAWGELAKYSLVTLMSDTVGALFERRPDLGLAAHFAASDRASSTSSLYAMLKLGGKAAVLPSLASRFGPLREFHFRQLKDPTLAREICVIVRAFRPTSPAMAALLATMQEITPQVGISSGAGGVIAMPWTLASDT